MKKQDPENREEDLRMLEAARETIGMLRAALLATVQRLQTGEDVPQAGKIKSSAADFVRALNQVIEIEAGLAKRSFEHRNGGAGACALDLAEARREILERLAVRVGQGDSGGISGGS